MAHQWRFFRSGGFDQVRLDQIEDWQHLDQLDPKLWAALSCPVKGLEFDARTMSYLDTDLDGRVRIDEVKAAVAWALAALQQPQVLLKGEELPLAAINTNTEDGKKLLASAKRILQNLGKADASALTVLEFCLRASLYLDLSLKKLPVQGSLLCKTLMIAKNISELIFVLMSW